MNIMFKIDGKVYTAATVGTVLPGVTRRSCIELLKDWGYEVVEGKIAIADIMAAAREASWKRCSVPAPLPLCPPSRSWSGRASTLTSATARSALSPRSCTTP